MSDLLGLIRAIVKEVVLLNDSGQSCAHLRMHNIDVQKAGFDFKIELKESTFQEEHKSLAHEKYYIAPEVN